MHAQMRETSLPRRLVCPRKCGYDGIRSLDPKVDSELVMSLHDNPYSYAECFILARHPLMLYLICRLSTLENLSTFHLWARGSIRRIALWR